ncbi:amino acid ABC transporter permease [Achromobacter aloeverae]|uniref:Amino acid ABC transporter permease n=1 Tax=Achromobacter aloeverae TaxID=1750518 RepID=A0A4Q1HHY5_9BURK|nr:amino acid ABC transporter permease [Achromobacter aloeverae]RXN86197.1 amino acid ABC transporter permease [Achromobacter aloeverae]
MDFLATLGAIFEGLCITALVTAYGMLYAVPFAVAFGVLQYFTRGTAHAVVTAIIEFWRSSPVIILLFMLYYTLPDFGIVLSSVAVGAMALGLNIGGYGSQAVRAALQALDRGQVEAGRALGMTRLQILVAIELPQAFAAMMPTFVNQFIQLVKGTALVSLIALTDMTFRAKQISQLEYAPARIYTALLVAYFVVCYPATILGRWLERRVSAGQRGNREF